MSQREIKQSSPAENVQDILDLDDTPATSELDEDITSKKYLLVYGFRRLNAAKKLGWKTVPCYINSKEELKIVPINEIYVSNKNTRLKEHSAEIQSLMSSMKQFGLLEPIGVTNDKNISEQDFLIQNITENLHRKDIAPIDYSAAIGRLKELGLNRGEISVRLSLNDAHIKNLENIGSVFSKEELAKIDYVDKSEHRKNNGKLSYSIAALIASSYLKNNQKKELLDHAKKEEYTVDDCRIIVKLMQAGMSLNDAIKNKDETKLITMQFAVNTKETKKLGLTTTHSITRYIRSILIGDTPANKKLFNFSKHDLNMSKKVTKTGNFRLLKKRTRKKPTWRNL